MAVSEAQRSRRGRPAVLCIRRCTSLMSERMLCSTAVVQRWKRRPKPPTAPVSTGGVFLLHNATALIDEYHIFLPSSPPTPLCCSRVVYIFVAAVHVSWRVAFQFDISAASVLGYGGRGASAWERRIWPPLVIGADSSSCERRSSADESPSPLTPPPPPSRRRTPVGSACFST